MKDSSEPTNHVADKALDDLNPQPLEAETENGEVKDCVLVVDGENQYNEDIYVAMLESSDVAEVDAEAGSELIAKWELKEFNLEAEDQVEDANDDEDIYWEMKKSADDESIYWEMKKSTGASEAVSECISENINCIKYDSEDTLDLADALKFLQLPSVDSDLQLPSVDSEKIEISTKEPISSFDSNLTQSIKKTASFNLTDVRKLLDDLDSIEKERKKKPDKLKTTNSRLKQLFPPLSETESPQAETESPQAETESPQAETESPQAETESPQAETESPQAETESPKTETESPQATAEEMSDIKKMLIEFNLLEGTELLKRGDRMGATIYFREAIRLDPNNPNLYLRLVEVIGYDKEAISEVEALLVKASELDPKNKKIKSMLLYLKERKDNAKKRIKQQDLNIQRKSQSRKDLKVPSVPDSETGSNGLEAKKFKSKSNTSSVQAAPVFLSGTESLVLPTSINIRNKAIIGILLILSILGVILTMRNQPAEKGEVKLLYPSKDEIVPENRLSLKWQASADLFVIQITENDQKIIERTTTSAKYDFTSEERALLKPGHTYTWTILPKNINAEDLPYKIEAFQFTVSSSTETQPSP